MAKSLVKVDRGSIGIFFAALIVAVGGIIYELILATASSYLVGNSVLHFSLTIGFFLFGMGFGSYLSKFIKSDPEERFLKVEIALSFIGGNSVIMLFFVYGFTELFYPFLILLIFVMGCLIGFEIPLMLQIMNKIKKSDWQSNVSNILSLDYLGALIASIAFPILILPYLGLIRSAYLVGILNLGIASILYFSFREGLKKPRGLLVSLIAVGAVLLIGFLYSSVISAKIEQKLYQDEIIHSSQSQYQKIVVTSYKDDLRMYLNGNLQFSSVDEYRYHESLVHIPYSFVNSRVENVLVLGGGDGLVVRELLKYDDIESIIVVDLDPEVVGLAMEHEAIKKLNEDSFRNDKVEVIHKDAYKFLEESLYSYELVIIDLPDPNDEALNKLYSKSFYDLVSRSLSVGGVFVTQSTSLYFSNTTFWTIENTIEEAGFFTYPYHANIPSFGDWGFVIGSQFELDANNIDLKDGLELRYLDNRIASSLFLIPDDLAKENIEEVQVNSIFNPVLQIIYEKDYKEWGE
jgi:spermidine synthase